MAHKLNFENTGNKGQKKPFIGILSILVGMMILLLILFYMPQTAFLKYRDLTVPPYYIEHLNLQVYRRLLYCIYALFFISFGVYSLLSKGKFSWVFLVVAIVLIVVARYTEAHIHHCDGAENCRSIWQKMDWDF